MSKFFDEHNDYDWDDPVEDMLKGMPNYQDFMNDDTAMMLMDAALFDKDASVAESLVARAMLSEYWMDEWGYDFNDFFDWDAWRDWVSPSGES